jgi:hypothetical protein
VAVEERAVNNREMDEPEEVVPPSTVQFKVASQNEKKLLEELRIVRLNQGRQKATLGHGLNHRNFKPRPAWEKKQWDIRKKAGDEND